MNMKYLHLPWILSETAGSDWVAKIYSTTTGEEIAQVYGNTKEETEARAKLIIRAPQLISICAQIKEWRDEEIKAFENEWGFNPLTSNGEISYDAHCSIQECDNHGDIQRAGIRIGFMQTCQRVITYLKELESG